jgi:hypothetical protein
METLETYGPLIDSASAVYHYGAPHDTTYINQTPFKDVTDWNRMSAHVEHLPAIFDKFLREVGAPAKHIKATTTEVPAVKAHTDKMWNIYCKTGEKVVISLTIVKSERTPTTKVR